MDNATPVAAGTARPDGRGRVAAAIAFSGTLLVVAQCLVNAGNFGFHLVTSRLLGPSSYGALSSHMAVLTALAVPVGAFETIVTGRVARLASDGAAIDGRAAWRRSLQLGIAATLVLAALTPWATHYLRMGTPWPWLWVSVYCIPLSLTVVPWGVVCGTKRFGRAGIAALTGAAIRVAAGSGLVLAGFGVSGALAATVLADCVRVALLVRPSGVLRRIPSGPSRPLRLAPRTAAASALAFAGLWVLLGIDTILARHLLPASAAGAYAAAALVSRASFFVTQAACVIAVPAFATRSRAQAREALARTLLIAAALGAGTTLALGLVGVRILPMVFGSAFRVSGPTLATLSFTAAELAILWITLQYQLARGLRAGGPAWLGVAVVLIAAPFCPRSPLMLAALMGIGVGTSLVLAGRSLAAAERTVSRPAMLNPLPQPVAGEPVDLTVVVPYYNPGDLLRPNLLNLLAALRLSEASFEVIAVGDGCTDGSPASIADVEPNVVRHFALPRNTGKGAALRLGLRQGRGRYIGFIDADGDLDPALWRPFLTLIGLYRPDVVIGSKVHPLSEIGPDITLARRACSIGYRALVRVLFPGLTVRDTQVGIKVFRRELLEDVLPLTVERRFVFDLELLVVARRMGYRRVMPAPVTLRSRTTSTIRASSVWRMACDTAALAWRLHVRRAYDPPAVDELDAESDRLLQEALAGEPVAGDQLTGLVDVPAFPAAAVTGGAGR